MSRITTEPTSTTVTDYYTMTPNREVNDPSLAAQERSKTAGELLQRQMKGTLQNFQGFMTGMDDTTRGDHLGKSLAGAETVKKGLGQYTSQPNVDMNSLMLEMNKLLSKMRDLQRDHAIQQQQQALFMQEKAYQREQDSISKNQSAATKTMITGFVGAGVGMTGSGLKLKGAIGKGSAESKQGKVHEFLKNNPGKSEEAAFSDINKKTSTSHWQKIKNAKQAPWNWGSSPNSMDALQKKISKNNQLSSSGDLLGQAPTLLNPLGQAISMGDTAAASQSKVEADRDKGLQNLNEREHTLREEQSRTASQQMRDVQREMNELYGKIATAVRW